MKKKLFARGGFTLTELLASIVVLLLVSMMMVTGVNFALRTYQKSMAASEAQTLCSTLTVAISDKLRFCSNVTKDTSGGVQQIFIQNVGTVDEAFQLKDGQVILGTTKLLGAAAYPEGLQVSRLTLDYDTDSNIFTISLEIADKSGAPQSDTTFQVKRINSRTE